MYEKLIKRLRAVVDGGREEKCDGCPYEEDYPCCVDCLDTLHKQAADAVEELEEKVQAYAETVYAYENPWISVTGEEPLKVGDDGYNGYLVYANGYYAVADYTTDKVDNVPYFHVDGEYEPNVTHYMPLPPPPMMEEEK